MLNLTPQTGKDLNVFKTITYKPVSTTYLTWLDLLYNHLAIIILIVCIVIFPSCCLFHHEFRTSACRDSSYFLVSLTSWWFFFNVFWLGFDDMDSIYASPDDFKKLNRQNKIRGLHLLEYFVNRCHEIGVLKNCLKCLHASFSPRRMFTHTRWCNVPYKLQIYHALLVVVMLKIL